MLLDLTLRPVLWSKHSHEVLFYQQTLLRKVQCSGCNCFITSAAGVYSRRSPPPPFSLMLPFLFRWMLSCGARSSTATTRRRRSTSSWCASTSSTNARTNLSSTSNTSSTATTSNTTQTPASSTASFAARPRRPSATLPLRGPDTSWSLLTFKALEIFTPIRRFTPPKVTPVLYYYYVL